MPTTDKPISGLTSAGSLLPTDLMEVVRSNQNLKTVLSQVRGTSIGKAMASTYTASIANPVSGLSFKMQRQARTVSPFASLLQTFLDPCVQDCGFYTRSGNTNVFTFANGQLSISSTANVAGTSQSVFSFEKFEFPGVSVAAEGITNTPDTGFNAMLVGISKNQSPNNTLGAFYEVGSGSNSRVTIAQTVAGTFTALATTSNASLPANVTAIALTVDGNSLTAWLQVSNNSWFPVLFTTQSAFDLVQPAELSQWSPYLQVTGGSSTAWKISRLRTGYSGITFTRDFKIVTNKDGNPYVSGGYLYFTESADYLSIVKFNPKTGDLQKCGALYFNRGGTYFLDLNAHLVWDEDLGQWHVVWASWGNGLGANVKIYHQLYDGDILNGVHAVTGNTQLAVTQASGAAVYDQCLLWDAANTRWLLAYAVSPGGTFGGNMYIALDSSPNLVTWTNVWAQTGTTGYEGANLFKVGGNFYVTAGNGAQFDCWNVAGTLLGQIVTDHFPSPASNPPPHFSIFPWMDADTTQYYALSENNTQFTGNAGVFSAGTLALYKATQTEVGFEFPCIGAT